MNKEIHIWTLKGGTIFSPIPPQLMRATTDEVAVPGGNAATCVATDMPAAVQSIAFTIARTSFGVDRARPVEVNLVWSLVEITTLPQILSLRVRRPFENADVTGPLNVIVGRAHKALLIRISARKMCSEVWIFISAHRKNVKNYVVVSEPCYLFPLIYFWELRSAIKFYRVSRKWNGFLIKPPKMESAQKQ